MEPLKIDAIIRKDLRMIRELIYNKLIIIRDRKKHDILKLEWQKAELEKLIKDKKEKQNR